MRLQVPLLVGLVVDPLVPTKEPQESTTVTPAEIIYHRRVQVLDRAGQTSVAEACRTFGISRTTSYRWAGRAQRYGLAALLPKGRRPPVMPTATPPDQVEAVLAEAVARPTLGARQLVDHLAVRGVRLSPSGGQKLLGRHRLGRRAQRADGFIGHTIFWERPVSWTRYPFYNVLSRRAMTTETIQPPLLAWAWRIAVGDPAAEPRIAWWTSV